MEEIHFNQGTTDPCIYIKESGTLAIVAVNVDSNFQHSRGNATD